MTDPNASPPSDDLLKEAIRYTDAGYGVIPVIPATKAPALRRWQKDFFKDRSAVEAHWQRHPDHGIGLVTGEATGIVVLDVDVKSDGLQTLSDLETQHGPLPLTVQSSTGGGGSHYLFTYPIGERIGSRAGIAPGLDIRAGYLKGGKSTGAGFIVAPPSLHESGTRYAWIRAPWEHDLAAAPSWLVDLMASPAASPAASAAATQGLVPAGQRHDFLVRSGIGLAKLGHGEAATLGMLQGLYETTCEQDPPMDSQELADIATWVASAGANESQIQTPEFPIDALPPVTRDVLARLAGAQDVSIDFIASQALVVAAAAIGTSRVIKTYTDDTLVQRPQPALLFLAVIGYPGAAKTESRFFLDKPVKSKELEYAAVYDQEVEQQAQREEEHRRIEEDAAKVHKKQLADWIASGAEGEGPSIPPAPPAERTPDPMHAWTDSATIEGIADALWTSPRGLLNCPDELSKLWLGFNKYSGGTGNDRQHYLEAWNAGTWKIIRADRRKNKLIPRAHISIVGGLQPELLPMIKGQFDDGSLDRWLCAWPEVIWLAKPKPTDLTFLGTWDTIIGKLYSLTVPAADQDPERVFLDTDALSIWEQDYGRIRDLYRTAPASMKGIYGKWGQYWARLALILHLLSWAEGTARDPGHVDADAARGATALMDYFTGMATKVRAAIDDAAERDGRTASVRACRRCQTSLEGKAGTAIYCSANCRKRDHEGRS